MDYKVFFAFQMDVEDKYGKGFIQSAIEIAIQKLKEEDILVSLDFGFRRTPGTPLLIEEMLKKSSDSDLVIADLTFTSAKEWLNAELIDEDDTNSWYSIPKGIRKLSPNPNVLLETGYAWAKKGTYRTLVVMNSAFGSPIELPVDLKGFRWGITYSLDETNKSDRKAIRKELGKDFYDAIKAAINAESSYQIEKWSPFKINQQIERYHNYPYVLTSTLKDEIEKLRDSLISYKGAIRIAGVPGSGKSRLVFEVFRRNEYFEVHKLENSILYFDLKGTVYQDISKKIVDLSTKNQLKIIILDNCDEEVHKKVNKEFYGTKLRLVTIEPNSYKREKVNPNIFIGENVRRTVFQNIFESKYTSTSSSLLYSSLDGDLNTLVPIIQASIKEENLNKSTNDLLKFIVGENNVDIGAVRLLTAIALFEKIGVSGDYKNQLEFIRETFVGCSEEECLKLIELLHSKNLIVKKGDYIVSNAFKEELIKHWKIEPIENINSIVLNVSKNNLWYNFSDKFFALLKNDESGEYLTFLISEVGVLKNNEFIDKSEGGKFLRLMVDYFPKLVLKILTSKGERL
ncbi:hypothetical protein [Lutibacter citreus]|uniref:hypothetical protein n=1 Tax=Lutibacter citreus TaxID=2138210 RepID=UPI000DBE1939|nr:hypothetical protein [Lutibacter citreus]